MFRCIVAGQGRASAAPLFNFSHPVVFLSDNIFSEIQSFCWKSLIVGKFIGIGVEILSIHFFPLEICSSLPESCNFCSPQTFWPTMLMVIVMMVTCRPAGNMSSDQMVVSQTQRIGRRNLLSVDASVSSSSSMLYETSARNMSSSALVEHKQLTTGFVGIHSRCMQLDYNVRWSFLRCVFFACNFLCIYLA